MDYWKVLTPIEMGSGLPCTTVPFAERAEVEGALCQSAEGCSQGGRGSSKSIEGQKFADVDGAFKARSLPSKEK